MAMQNPFRLAEAPSAIVTLPVLFSTTPPQQGLMRPIEPDQMEETALTDMAQRTTPFGLQQKINQLGIRKSASAPSR